MTIIEIIVLGAIIISAVLAYASVCYNLFKDSKRDMLGGNEHNHK